MEQEEDSTLEPAKDRSSDLNEGQEIVSMAETLPSLTAEHRPLKIHAVGLDERGTRMLNFFFQKFCVGRCEMVAGDQAEVFLINMDSVDAVEQRTTLEISSPLTPIILMSLHVVDSERHYFIRKPLIAEQLLAILTKIEQLPNRQNSQVEEEEQVLDNVINSVTVDTSEEKITHSSHSVMSAAQKMSKAETVHFFGNRPDVDLLDEANKEAIYFDLKQYYLGHVQEAMQLAKENNCSIKLTGLSHTLFISPNLDLVYVELSDAQLRYYGVTALYKKDTQSRYRTKFSYQLIKDEEVDKLCGRSPNYQQNLQSFLWKLSLWTSRGRLPVGISLNILVYIQAWPNFTRLTEIPNALRIVAGWLPKPQTILKMTENLQIPQRNIFSFFTATYVLGLSGLVGDESDILILPIIENSENNNNPKNKMGIFSRLIKKLTVN